MRRLRCMRCRNSVRRCAHVPNDSGPSAIERNKHSEPFERWPPSGDQPPADSSPRQDTHARSPARLRLPARARPLFHTGARQRIGQRLPGGEVFDPPRGAPRPGLGAAGGPPGPAAALRPEEPPLAGWRRHDVRLTATDGICLGSWMDPLKIGIGRSSDQLAKTCFEFF